MSNRWYFNRGNTKIDSLIKQGQLDIRSIARACNTTTENVKIRLVELKKKGVDVSKYI